MLKILSICFGAKTWPIATSIGLLVLRIVSGGMMLYGHGYGKITNFSANAESFPDPLGVGNTTSLALAIAAEFFCAIFVVLGLGTRLATLPLIAAMGVAAFVVHRGETLSEGEKALLYLAPYVVLLFTGPGQFSIDALIGGKVVKGGD